MEQTVELADLKRFEIESKFKPLFELWIEALRSREYKQGEGLLKRFTDNTHCCLGVLCEITVPMGQQPVVNNHGSLKDLLDLSLLNTALFPEQLYSSNTCDLANYLMCLNDGDISGYLLKNLVRDSFRIQFSFEQIANFLENNIDYVQR